MVVSGVNVVKQGSSATKSHVIIAAHIGGTSNPASAGPRHIQHLNWATTVAADVLAYLGYKPSAVPTL